MRTEYVRHTTGSILYVKPSPLATSPWSTGVVLATENGTTGEYVIASLDELSTYTVFVRAGGSPANTDIAIAQIELAPSGGSGGLDAAGVRAAIGLAAANLDIQIASLDSSLDAVGTINVLPLNAAVQSRVRGTTIEVFSGETVLVSIAVVDAAGSAVSLTGRTLRIVLESPGSTADRTVIEDGSIARSGNTVSFAIVGGSTGARRQWSLRDTSGDVVLAHGVVSTTYAPKKD